MDSSNDRLQGKALGVPVYDLLGGRQRNSLPCSWPLATGDAGAEIEEAEQMMETGQFNLFKLKMGALDPGPDVERACAVSRALEGKARVRVDPNEMWDEATSLQMSCGDTPPMVFARKRAGIARR